MFYKKNSIQNVGQGTVGAMSVADAVLDFRIDLLLWASDHTHIHTHTHTLRDIKTEDISLAQIEDPFPHLVKMSRLFSVLLSKYFIWLVGGWEIDIFTIKSYLL